jgi:hypothetical protein
VKEAETGFWRGKLSIGGPRGSGRLEWEKGTLGQDWEGWRWGWLEDDDRDADDEDGNGVEGSTEADVRGREGRGRSYKGDDDEEGSIDIPERDTSRALASRWASGRSRRRLICSSPESQSRKSSGSSRIEFLGLRAYSNGRMLADELRELRRGDAWGMEGEEVEEAAPGWDGFEGLAEEKEERRAKAEFGWGAATRRSMSEGREKGSMNRESRSSPIHSGAPGGL